MGDVGDVFDPDVERFSVRMQLLKQVFVDMDVIDKMHTTDDIDADDIDAVLGSHLECAHLAQVSRLREEKRERARKRESEKEGERSRKKERDQERRREIKKEGERSRKKERERAGKHAGRVGMKEARVGGGKSWKSIELEEYRGGKSCRQELEEARVGGV